MNRDRTLRYGMGCWFQDDMSRTPQSFPLESMYTMICTANRKNYEYIQNESTGKIKCLASFIKDIDSSAIPLSTAIKGFLIKNENSCKYDKCDDIECACHSYNNQKWSIPTWITNVIISNPDVEKKLISLPEIIMDIKTLLYLNISSNNIERIPDEINKLSNLGHLDATNNPLVYISSNIKSLTSLTTLRLTVKSNRTHIPDELFGLELYKLCCCNCNHNLDSDGGLYIDYYDNDEKYDITRRRNFYYNKRINKKFSAIIMGNDNKLCDEFCSNNFTQLQVKLCSKARKCNACDDIYLDSNMMMINLGSMAYRKSFEQFFEVMHMMKLIVILTLILILLVLIVIRMFIAIAMLLLTIIVIIILIPILILILDNLIVLHCCRYGKRIVAFQQIMLQISITYCQ